MVVVSIEVRIVVRLVVSVVVSIVVSIVVGIVVSVGQSRPETRRTNLVSMARVALLLEHADRAVDDKLAPHVAALAW